MNRTDISDSDSDSDSNSFVLNEEELPTIEEEFLDQISKCKHSIDKYITDNNKDTDAYLGLINNLYDLCLKSQQLKKCDTEDIKSFPKEVEADIKLLCNWIGSYFSRNSVADQIPYEYHIRMSLHEHPYINNSYDYE